MFNFLKTTVGEKNTKNREKWLKKTLKRIPSGVLKFLMLEQENRNTRNFVPIKKNRRLELEVDKWRISKFILQNLIPVIGIKPYPLDELTMFVSTVCAFEPTHIYEWGTHVGKSARIFYETVKYFKINAKIFTTDLPKSTKHIEHPGDSRGLYIRNITEIQRLCGDGVTESLKIQDKVKKNNKPLFYLDGDHGYKSIKRELFLIGKHANHATIIIHDTFYQTKKSKYNIGPHKAIQDFLKVQLNYKIYTTHFGLPGMTVLIAKKNNIK